MAAATKPTPTYGAAIELQAKGDAGIVSGYASVYGLKDRNGTVLDPGVFTKSLAALRAKGRSIPMLWAHRTDKAVGTWETLTEDHRGLKVRGRINLDTQSGKEARSLLQSSSVTGLSIGARRLPGGSRWDRDTDTEHLSELELLEVSLVPIPANDETRIIEARSFGPEETPHMDAEQQPDLNGWQADITAAHSKLADEVRSLSEKVGSMVLRPAAARGVGIARHEPVRDVAAEERAAVREIIRTGEITTIERRDLVTVVDSSGGFAVPVGMDRQINDILISVSPIRSIARTVEVSHVGEFEVPIGRRGATSAWADELDTRLDTQTPNLASVSPPGGELYSLATASTWMIEDGIFGIEDWLLRNLTDEHAFQEGVAFISGNGIKKPLGFLAGPAPVTTGDATRAFGTLQYTPTGFATGFLAANPADSLIDLQYSLAAPYRANAVWVMNSATAGAIRKMKNATTNEYIWQPSIVPGVPDSILGSRVVIAEDMPAIGAGNFSVAYGDFQRGYLIVDKRGTNILRDPYTRKGFIKFFMTRRVHGIPTDSNAIKVLKVAAT